MAGQTALWPWIVRACACSGDLPVVLRQVVRGYFQNHGIPGNQGRMNAFRNDALRTWFEA